MNLQAIKTFNNINMFSTFNRQTKTVFSNIPIVRVGFGLPDVPAVCRDYRVRNAPQKIDKYDITCMSGFVYVGDLLVVNALNMHIFPKLIKYSTNKDPLYNLYFKDYINSILFSKELKKEYTSQLIYTLYHDKNIDLRNYYIGNKKLLSLCDLYIVN